MKLRNKKTGEMGYIAGIGVIHNDKLKWFETLAELNEKWEDYEEPKNQYYLDCDGRIFEQHTTEYIRNKMKEIGNYFDTREEAEKAVEKLKAVKKLKDAGCRVTEYKTYGGTTSKGEFIGEVKLILDVPDEVDKELLFLLFGGEE